MSSPRFLQIAHDDTAAIRVELLAVPLSILCTRVLALAITYGGMLGKVYTEILESTDTRPAHAILEAGGGRFAALAYGLLPNAAQELTSYTVYRWECAVRASVIMGFVGAGGLGQMLYFHLSIFQQAQAATVLIAMFVLVLTVDALSDRLRAGMGRN